jgi:hypothetical protein
MEQAKRENGVVKPPRRKALVSENGPCAKMLDSIFFFARFVKIALFSIQ